MDFKDILAEEILAKKKLVEQAKAEKLAPVPKPKESNGALTAETVLEKPKQVVSTDTDDLHVTKRKHSDEGEAVFKADSDEQVHTYCLITVYCYRSRPARKK